VKRLVLPKMLSTLREFLRHKPFRPFRVVMRSGKRYDIVNPEKVAIGSSKAYAFFPRMTEIPERSRIDL
jgi:hypothetical protein